MTYLSFFCISLSANLKFFFRTGGDVWFPLLRGARRWSTPRTIHSTSRTTSTTANIASSSSRHVAIRRSPWPWSWWRVTVGFLRRRAAASTITRAHAPTSSSRRPIKISRTPRTRWRRRIPAATRRAGAIPCTTSSRRACGRTTWWGTPTRWEGRTTSTWTERARSWSSSSDRSPGPGSRKRFSAFICIIRRSAGYRTARTRRSTRSSRRRGDRATSRRWTWTITSSLYMIYQKKKKLWLLRTYSTASSRTPASVPSSSCPILIKATSTASTSTTSPPRITFPIAFSDLI